MPFTYNNTQDGFNEKKTTDHKIKLLNKNHNERIKNVHAKYVNTHVRQGVLMIMFESDKLYF